MSVDRPAADDTSRPRYSYRDKVLHAFVVEGRLTSIPARERKRQVILRHLASTDFEEGRDYPEREVDQRLALRHRDVAALRRYLVDNHYLERSAGIYRRRPMSDWPVDQDETMTTGDARMGEEAQARRRPRAPGDAQARAASPEE